MNSRTETLLQTVLETGDINSVCDLGLTTMHWACYRGKVETVQALLDLGASVNVAAVSKEQTLPPPAHHYASWGCNSNPVVRQGTTALHYACSRGHIDVLILLLFYEADVEACDADGLTPLHAAAAEGRENAIRLLFEEGANLFSKTKAGLTPFDLASARQNKSTSALLEDLLQFAGGTEPKERHALLDLKNKILEDQGSISSDAYVKICKKISIAYDFSHCSSDPDASHNKEPTLFLPCCHVVMCGVCAEELRSRYPRVVVCPECQAIVTDFVLNCK